MEAGPSVSTVLGDSVGPCTMTNADDVYVMPPDFARRALSDVQRLLPFQEGDEVRDWALHNASWLLNVYDEKCEVLSQQDLGSNVMSYLKLYGNTLQNRVSFGNKTFKELGRAWYSFERMNANKYSTPQFITYGEIATHAHFVYSSARRIFERDSMTMKLPPNATAADHHLLAAVLNSSIALFWLKQVCFSKRESSKPEADTYYVFAGGKVEQLPVPDCVVAALSYRTEQGGEGESLKPGLGRDDEQ